MNRPRANLRRTASSLVALLVAVVLATGSAPHPTAAAAPLQVGFLWHMHQPIYYPGENILQTQAANRYSFSLFDVHNQRVGPYTTWPRNAIQAGLGLAHLGAQVSFSGSLMANLNHLESAGVNGGMWSNWDASYRQAAQWTTALGNPRLDLVAFGYHHPLMPLLDERDMRMQIKLHKYAHQQVWGPNVPYSKGIFPPETAFSQRMIPALAAEGIEWAIVDNIHFDRATQGYPHTSASNLYPPNPSDQINPDPAASGGAWIQLNNLWAPSRVSAPFSYRPHHVQHVDPQTGEIHRIVAVPAARYEGNEDGRGGFGALQYEQVMEQYRHLNTDPTRPMLVLLHHDGDNFGGGSEAYYHGNFQNMVSWAAGNPNYDVTTIQDYLDRFPAPDDALIHVESGSWAGADNGDPEYKKWLGDPNAQGWSPDRNSWAVLTAAKNRVFTADDLAPWSSIANIAQGTGSPTERAWHHLLEAQASDHWYWDGTEVWDSNVTRGANLAVVHANQVINAAAGVESTPPTIFLPQREAYNPGGYEFGSTRQPSDFEVWTYAYDVSGLSSVTLNYRVDLDGFNPLDSIQNETYAGGPEVGAWQSTAMTASDVAPPPGILAPAYRALRYGAMIEGLQDVLIDYYVEAIDGRGNIARSDIQHVYIGTADAVGGGTTAAILPNPAQAGEFVTVAYDPAGRPLASASQVLLHYGFDNWATVSPNAPMSWDASASRWTASVPVPATATSLDMVFTDGAGLWDNNGGQDWHFPVTGAAGPAFVMDGQLDARAMEIGANGGRRLFAAVEGSVLYVAADDAGEGSDVFIYVAREPGDLRSANWAKSGLVASWDAYLADENDNNFAAWFDVASGTAAATGANGGVLEGTIDLAAAFAGNIPAEIYLAVGHYATADGGALTLQIPASLDGNLDINAAEFVRFALASALAADFNRDGRVDADDLGIWSSAFGLTAAGDANGDGQSDGADLLVWQRQLGAGSTSHASQQATPEPDAAALVAVGLAASASWRRLRAFPGRRAGRRVAVASLSALPCFWAVSASAQPSPDPSCQRRRLFDSYEQFKARLDQISAVDDHGERHHRLDALWAELGAAGQIPYAHGDQAAFLYRGSARAVAVAGDFNGWNPSGPDWQAAQVPGTDLWLLECRFPPDARLDYKFVVDASQWVLDPANPGQMWSGLGGPNSELRMPDYKFPEVAVRREGVPCGAMSDDTRFRSDSLGYDVSYRVYTPAGYDPQQSADLPTVYVTDGHEYAADHLGGLMATLDNMIAAGQLQPIVAVFLDPRDPTTGANRRMSEYVANDQFVRCVADELVPRIDAEYRTLAAPQGRTVLGTSLGGLASAYLGATRPEVFRQVIVQSPASFSALAPQVLEMFAAQPLAAQLQLFVTAGTIGDGQGARELTAVLADGGYEYGLLEVNQGHSWGNWRDTIAAALTKLIGPKAPGVTHHLEIQ